MPDDFIILRKDVSVAAECVYSDRRLSRRADGNCLLNIQYIRLHTSVVELAETGRGFELYFHVLKFTQLLTDHKISRIINIEVSKQRC